VLQDGIEEASARPREKTVWRRELNEEVLMKAGRMKVRVLVSALIVMASHTGAMGADQREVSQAGFGWKDGGEVYTKTCALCHETSVGPALRGRELDPLYIRLMVRNGSRAMPAFRASEIDDPSLEKLAEYVSKAPAGK
jgi:mono/diheme cytochrome c family protein